MTPEQQRRALEALRAWTSRSPIADRYGARCFYCRMPDYRQVPAARVFVHANDCAWQLAKDLLREIDGGDK